MSKEKVSIQDLVDAISQQTGSSKKKAEDFLRVFQSTIEEGLVSDGIVKIKGFGTFKLVWNEPRKSVNVQTKEEYVIPGHYKVSFVPEASVKDTINEPMGSASEKKSDEESLPLKKLNEQAEEIKVLISELKEVNKPEVKEEKVEMVSEEAKSEEIKSQPIVAETSNESEEQTAAPEDYQIHERDIPVVQKKKKRTWLIIPIVILLLAGAGYGLYRLDLLPKAPAPRLADMIEETDSTEVDSEKITAKEPVTNVADSSTVVETPAVVEEPKAAEPVKQPEVKAEPVKKEEPKVSIFDKKRVYSQFIGSVTIEKGSRLTLIAEEHYGHKNFWVYIYEANKSRIKNPGNLQIGFVVKLPKLPAELIDVNNPECVEYAAELERKYAYK